MRTLVSLPTLATLVTVLASTTTAHAQKAAPPITIATPTTSAHGSYTARSTQVTPALGTPAWQKNGSWGWFVVASSIFVGTGLTGFGLGQTCDDPEGVNACTRGTSMALWGGIGIAALGSAIGLIIVQEGRAKATGQNFGVIKLGPLGDFRLAPPL